MTLAVKDLIMLGLIALPLASVGFSLGVLSRVGKPPRSSAWFKVSHSSTGSVVEQRSLPRWLQDGLAPGLAAIAIVMFILPSVAPCWVAQPVIVVLALVGFQIGHGLITQLFSHLQEIPDRVLFSLPMVFPIFAIGVTLGSEPFLIRVDQMTLKDGATLCVGVVYPGEKGVLVSTSDQATAFYTWETVASLKKRSGCHPAPASKTVLTPAASGR